MGRKGQCASAPIQAGSGGTPRFEGPPRYFAATYKFHQRKQYRLGLVQVINEVRSPKSNVRSRKKTSLLGNSLSGGAAERGDAGGLLAGPGQRFHRFG